MKLHALVLDHQELYRGLEPLAKYLLCVHALQEPWHHLGQEHQVQQFHVQQVLVIATLDHKAPLGNSAQAAR